MRKRNRVLIQILIFFIIVLSGCKVFAKDNIEIVELSEDYKKYLELSEEEQAKLNNSCKVIKEMREQSIDKIIKG